MTEVYLDNAATTKTDEDAARAALSVMTEEYGNPSSLHDKGLRAQKRLEQARGQVAGLLDCEPDKLIFTSGGTEANNLALRGGADALRRRGNHIVATAFEHASVLSTLAWLEKQGFAVTYVDPEPDGNLDPVRVAAAVTDKTILVTAMLVNSEVGTILPVDRLSALVRRKNGICLIHCDAVQAFGKLSFSARRLGADLITVSGHKLHAPKGVGALYVGGRINPVTFGGHQERGLRPGTEPVALACAFGHAARQAKGELRERQGKIAAVSGYFDQKALEFSGLCINSPGSATPYIRNLSLPGCLSAHLINSLSGDGVYVSGGSACSGGAKSHVLTAMGLPEDRIAGALRVSFSKDSTAEDVDRFFEALGRARERLAGRR